MLQRNVIISCAANHSLKMLALWKLILCHTVTKYLCKVDLERQGEDGCYMSHVWNMCAHTILRNGSTRCNTALMLACCGKCILFSSDISATSPAFGLIWPDLVTSCPSRSLSRSDSLYVKTKKKSPNQTVQSSVLTLFLFNFKKCIHRHHCSTVKFPAQYIMWASMVYLDIQVPQLLHAS